MVVLSRGSSWPTRPSVRCKHFRFYFTFTISVRSVCASCQSSRMALSETDCKIDLGRGPSTHTPYASLPSRQPAHSMAPHRLLVSSPIPYASSPSRQSAHHMAPHRLFVSPLTPYALTPSRQAAHPICLIALSSVRPPHGASSPARQSAHPIRLIAHSQVLPQAHSSADCPPSGRVDRCPRWCLICGAALSGRLALTALVTVVGPSCSQ